MVVVSIKMNEELKNATADYAKMNDLSVSQVIRKALTEFLERNTKQEKE